MCDRAAVVSGRQRTSNPQRSIGRPDLAWRFRAQWCRFVMLIFLAVVAGKASAAAAYDTESIVSGYGGCSWREADGYIYADLTINFAAISGITAIRGLDARAVVLYTYDDNGQLANPSSDFAEVWLNGVRHSIVYHDGWIPNWVYSNWGAKSVWGIDQAFSAKLEVRVKKAKLNSKWPGFSVQAANEDKWHMTRVEISGGAYLSPNDIGGTCKQIVDPGIPPEPWIGINVSAPDWNLGELPPGEGQTVLTNTADQLCFTYAAPMISGKKFIVNASSANGVAANRYRLKNVDDASKLVPYNVTLNSGTSSVSLPNATNTTLSLDSSGKTCFVPTFKTSVGFSATEGDYSDVLTFTVVTKS